MAIKSRPGFEVNVDRTLKSTENKSVFYDVKPGTSHNLRFLPPSDPTGSLFFESAQHFNFTEEGQKRAWACLRIHGEEGADCPICKLVEAAKESGDDRFEKIIKNHAVSYRWHAQVLPLPREDKPVEQLYVVGLSKQTAQKVSNIMKMERDNRQPLITDPDKGQAVNITRNDKSGLQTRYEVQATGLRIPLDEIYAKWTDEFLNVQEAVGLRIVDADRLEKSILETVGNSNVKALLG